MELRKQIRLPAMVLALLLAVVVIVAVAGPPSWKRFQEKRIQHDSEMLRIIAQALEKYYIDRSEYPPDLNYLTRFLSFNKSKPYLEEIPRSAFGHREAPMYFYNGDQNHCILLLWTPGPDRKYNIEIGGDFQEALKEYDNSKAGKDVFTFRPTWIRDRTYDPTNGATSGGDIFRPKQ